MSDEKQHDAAVEARIQHIVEMMLDFTFRRGKTVKDLAEQWGLTRGTVRHYTAEASKRVMANFNDVEAVKLDIGIVMREVIETARQDLHDPPMVMGPSGEAFAESPNKTRQVLINAVDKFADIMGTKSASKVELSGSVGLEDIEAAKAAAKANEETSE